MHIFNGFLEANTISFFEDGIMNSRTVLFDAQSLKNWPFNYIEGAVRFAISHPLLFLIISLN
ncbi:hypothetical protein J18TS1_38900 [Oceanobacillus oncorhynchi subsp. incaldanensis]|nr:hypothetical protein J18TS1_38900 [Oceanobacillus oncorhynchi subsp. incaldanensis]